MKKSWRDLQNRVYFIPLLYCLIALLFAALVVHMELVHIDQLARIVPAVFLTEAPLAQTIHASMIGALLTLITVSFSSILVVLTLYAGQFSPRVIQDFLERKDTLRILGLFMGTFIFSLITLYFTRSAERQVISPSFGVLLAILCLGNFGYFIHHVAKSIQINNIIETMTREIISVVDRTIDNIKTNDLIRTSLLKPAKLATEAVAEVTYGAQGFIRHIDMGALVKLSSEYNVMLLFRRELGDYVEDEDVIVRAYCYDPVVEFSQGELFQRIRDTITIGEQRGTREDVEFGIIKLVEIALRAMSPGINDPNTAVLCINKLGAVLRKIGTELEKIYYYDEDMVVRVLVNNLAFKPLLYNTYYQLREYGKDDVSVNAALIDSLIQIVHNQGYTGGENVWEICKYILEGINPTRFPGLDLQHINGKVQRLARIVGVDDAADVLLKKSAGSLRDTLE